MSTIYNGVALSFGNGDVAITAIASKIGTMIIQDWDLAQKADKETTRDEGGVLVNKTYYNPSKDASFSYIVKGTGLVDADAQVLAPPIGTLVTVTSTKYPQIAGTSWSVEDASVKSSNTKNKMVTLKLELNPSITSAAGA